MSRLQHALHALPGQSVVTGNLASANIDFNNILDSKIKSEVADISRLKMENNCTWSSAIDIMIANKYEANR